MSSLKVLATLLSLLFFFTATAQIKAVTEDGDQVLLSSNGTWRFVEEVKNNDSIQWNLAEFKKPVTANFLLKSKHSRVGFWLNPKKWNFEKATGGDAEFNFSLKENTSVGAMVVVEPVGMELKSLRTVAIENFNKAASESKIIKEEYRHVNGLDFLYIEFNAVVQGIHVTYANYYFTDSLSTVQFITYMPNGFVEKFRTTCEDLLNGLVNINKADSSQKDNIKINSAAVDNSDCKGLFKGVWSYSANGVKYFDKIEGNRMIETNAKNKFQSVYSIKWIDNCRYDLLLQQSNDPATKLINNGMAISIEIMEIDHEKMRYKLTYGEKRNTGEMKKESR